MLHFHLYYVTRETQCHHSPSVTAKTCFNITIGMLGLAGLGLGLVLWLRLALKIVEELEFLPMRCYASVGTSYGPVSASVISQCSIETVERIGLVFGTGASFHQYYTML